MFWANSSGKFSQRRGEPGLLGARRERSPGLPRSSARSRPDPHLRASQPAVPTCRIIDVNCCLGDSKSPHMDFLQKVHVWVRGRFWGDGRQTWAALGPPFLGFIDFFSAQRRGAQRSPAVLPPVGSALRLAVRPKRRNQATSAEQKLGCL
jgi:hypothetical protein